jgi:hypothetical protein
VSGLLFEGPELVVGLMHIIGHGLQKHRDGFSLPSPETSDWVKLVAFVGWIFIVLGVGGELYTQSYISDADTNIQ